MTDFSGLQIDVRCIRCGRLPTAEVTLFEMQNHLYICEVCRQQAEQGGKQIKWVAQSEAPASTALPLGSPGARVVTTNLPANSLFAILNLPLTSSIEEIESAIVQRMRQLLREEDSPERTQKIERLHELQEKTEDPAAFEEYRNSFKNQRHHGQALSVGGRLVYDAEEFLSACEASREGWADGERYLRLGQLQHWIIFQIEDRELASKIRYYQILKDISIFRAFNEALYCLVPERPFRFYKQEAWEALTTLSSASTPEELAQKCDLHWQLAEYHLYSGSLAYWLGDARGISGIKEYYRTTIAGFANKQKDRGLGLELLLEKALPALPRPHLVVTFDGTEGEYAVTSWDRELAHQPVAVKVTNTTRGFTSIDLVLQPSADATEPQWIALTRPTHIAGIPGDGTMPATTMLALTNLTALRWGKKYRRTLTMIQAGEPGSPPLTQEFPISFKTQPFFAGLRGIFWRWGLRGGLLGFAWNFVIGTFLAFLFYLIIPAVVPYSYLHNPTDTVSFGSCLQYMIAGTIDLLRTFDISTLPVIKFSLPSIKFPLFVGIMMGLIGFGVGNSKGHADYTEKQGASAFRKGAFWFAVAFVIALFILDQTGIATIQVMQSPSVLNVFYAFFSTGGSIAIGILTLVIAFLLVFIRSRVEKYLRARYQSLLDMPGRA